MFEDGYGGFFLCCMSRTYVFDTRMCLCMEVVCHSYLCSLSVMVRGATGARAGRAVSGRESWVCECCGERSPRLQPTSVNDLADASKA